MSQLEESFDRAIALVEARVVNDTDGMRTVLDGLDSDGAEHLVTALAAAFAQFGVETSGGPDAFVQRLHAMRERF